MSLLQQLRTRRKTLKTTETIVTRADGCKFKEVGNDCVKIQSTGPGFVVDTQPDETPALIIPHLYLGSQDCAAPDVLQRTGIKRVLSLGVRPFQTTPDCQYEFRELLDLPESNIWETLEDVQEFIREAIQVEENVLVHCNAGVSRSAAIVIGFLIKFHRMSYEEAHALVKESRKSIRPNDSFIRQLKSRCF